MAGQKVWVSGMSDLTATELMAHNAKYHEEPSSDANEPIEAILGDALDRAIEALERESNKHGIVER